MPHTRSGPQNGDETTSNHQDVGLPSRSTLSKTSQIAGILRKKRIGVKKVQNFVFGSRFFVLPEDAVVRVDRAARASNNRSFQTVQLSPLPSNSVLMVLVIIEAAFTRNGLFAVVQIVTKSFRDTTPNPLCNLALVGAHGTSPPVAPETSSITMVTLALCSFLALQFSPGQRIPVRKA